MTMPKVTQPLEVWTLHSAAGKVATTWVKIRIDMPLPMPRSVMSSPSHMMTAVPAVMVMTMTRNVAVPSSCSRSGHSPGAGAVARERHDAGGLQHREAQGQVAGVLGDLRLTGLPLLLQRLEPWDHHDEQLQDDGGRDVRHDPQREDGELEQRTTREEVDQAVEATLLELVDAGLDVGDVDARGGHLRAESEDRDDQQDEEQLAPQVRSPESVGERA